METQTQQKPRYRVRYVTYQELEEMFYEDEQPYIWRAFCRHHWVTTIPGKYNLFQFITKLS